jgi:hypothetical protein
VWSESGDWFLRTEHCFRASGVVARLSSNLMFLPTKVAVIETIEFDQKAQELRRGTNYFDVDARDVMKPPDQQARDWLNKMRTVYTKVTELPFWKLLSADTGGRNGFT